jgi:carbon monoxide dehydrogenase subunit G
MEIKQRFIVRHRPRLVWDALADAPFAVQCLPGAELDDSADGIHYTGRMRVKLGPLSAAFAGDAVVQRDAQAQSATIDWTGIDKKSNSRAKAHMVYAVLSQEGGEATAVEIVAEIGLSGALAQFGRSGIVNDVAARLTQMFADNLQTRLNAVAESAPQVAPQVAPDAASATAGTAPSPEAFQAEQPAAILPRDDFKAAELRPLQLLWSILARRLATRLRGWADRLEGRAR